MPSRQLASRITYADAARSRPGRAAVRLIEALGGRVELIRRAEDYQTELARGRGFWDVMCDRYGIGLEVVGGTLETLPREGPLVVVANHPFGILDGLMLGRILSDRRAGDFRIMAHSVFELAPELRHTLLPVDFSETREALARNIATRVKARDYLAGGGAIGIFPGGTVSTAPTPWGPALDPAWRSFTARLVARSDAIVVPLFFEGANSRLFQIASHVHYTLRLGLLIPEFRTRVGTDVRIVVGEPISRASLEAFGHDARGLMAFLRRQTYALSPRPLPSHRLGYEFEAKYREESTARRNDLPGAAPEPLGGL